MNILDIDQYILRNPHIGLLTSAVLVIANAINLQFHNVFTEFSLYVSTGAVLLVAIYYIVIVYYMYTKMLTDDIDWNKINEAISNSERMSYFQTEKCGAINIIGYVCIAIIAALQENMLVVLFLVLNMMSLFIYLSVYTYIQSKAYYSLFEYFK